MAAISFVYIVQGPHALGFSPYELLYAHQVRVPLDVIHETWEGPGKLQDMNIVSCVLKMREQLMKSTAVARENLLQAQAKQEKWYDG